MSTFSGQPHELLDAFRSGEGLDLIKEAVTLVCQELIETELSSVIGADRYERTDTRVTERNGYRPRLLSTKAGDVELAIPKLRKGSFFPTILEPRRRIDQALYAVVMEAYVHGVEIGTMVEIGAPRRLRDVLSLQDGASVEVTFDQEFGLTARKCTPKIAEGLDIRETDDGRIVYQESTDKVHHLNNAAAGVLELCDGNRKTVHRLAQFLAVTFLLTAKLIDWRNRWCPGVVPIR